MILNLKQGVGKSIAWMILLACLGARAAAADVNVVAPSLDRGFLLLYSLNFDQAHQIFSEWQQEHPEDPLGPVCDATGLLFSEFNRLGVLEAQFYEDDRTFQGRKKLSPDPAVRDRFNAQLSLAETKARAQLARNAKDRDALFAMTLASGLRADYAALIEKSNFTALRYTKEATAWAKQLLAVDPDCYDAHLASGISQYIVGSMAAPVRWILHLGGVSGDRKAGIQELQVTAQHGRYLAPFARILLAIAYVRAKDKQRAREMLESLRGEFPANPLFAHELARLESGP
jgi:hypothetical protein